MPAFFLRRHERGVGHKKGKLRINGETRLTRNQVGKKTMKLVIGFEENQRVGNKFFKVGRKNLIVGKKIQKAGNKADPCYPKEANFK